MNDAEKVASIITFYQKLGFWIPAEMLVEYLGKTPLDPITTGGRQREDLLEADIYRGSNGKYLRKAMRLLPVLRYLPGVRAVAVCNSVALGAASVKSDIDLLIITDPKRLWIARVLCTGFLHIFGLRRHHARIAGRFCLSFFVSENALGFEKIALSPRDPYLAFWVSSLIPIFGKEYFLKIARLNRQFAQNHAGIVLRFEKNVHTIPSGRSALRSLLELFLGKRFDVFLKRFLLPRSERKRDALPDKSGIVISDNMLKFHNRDSRKLFLS